MPVTGDTTNELDETLTLTLSNVSANATVGTATATGTIENDDPGSLNDTAITTCSDGANNRLSCPRSDYPGQDAEYGRDANSATNSDSDGHAGFSFVKIGSTGQPLAIQNGTWSNSGSEAAGTKWSCVQDNVTKLVWEVDRRRWAARQGLDLHLVQLHRHQRWRQRRYLQRRHLQRFDEL